MKKSTSKQNTPKFDESIMKVDVERSGCDKFLQDYKFMKRVVKTSIAIVTILFMNLKS